MFYVDRIFLNSVFERSIKVETILDEAQLREEIGFLSRSLRTKRRLASLRAGRVLQPSPSKTRASYEHSSTKITLLMDWVRTVCDFYNLKASSISLHFNCCRADYNFLLLP